MRNIHNKRSNYGNREDDSIDYVKGRILVDLQKWPMRCCHAAWCDWLDFLKFQSRDDRCSEASFFNGKKAIVCLKPNPNDPERL